MSMELTSSKGNCGWHGEIRTQTGNPPRTAQTTLLEQLKQSSSNSSGNPQNINPAILFT